MKLCTFEVQTPVGRRCRLGAVTEQGIADLNFACARLLFRKGETRPCELADVLVPDNMLDFLGGGKTAMEAAAEALDSAKDSKPGTPEIGTEGETLVYLESNVRLLAPVTALLSSVGSTMILAMRSDSGSPMRVQLSPPSVDL